MRNSEERPVRVLVSFLCLWLMVAGVASAQDPPSQQTPPQLVRLHDALRLGDQQQDAWRDYVTGITPNAEVLARRGSTQRLLPQLTTPRRIALIEAAMEQDLADFRRQAAAISTFYGRLSLDQQHIFDQETVPRGGGPSGD